MFDNLIGSNVEFMAQWTRIAVAIHYFIAISSSIFDSENTSGLTSRRFSYTPAPPPEFNSDYRFCDIWRPIARSPEWFQTLFLLLFLLGFVVISFPKY